MKKRLFNPIDSWGFTLVELLVTITIIGILSLVGYSTYSNIQKSARDTLRKADIDSMAAAYEDGYSPVSGTYSTLSGSQFTKGVIPSPPPGTADYTKIDGPDASPSPNPLAFKVCAVLESGATYCRSNQQGPTSTVAFVSPSPTTTTTLTPSPTPFPSAGLVAYWKMDEASWNGTAEEVKYASATGINGNAGCDNASCTKPTTISPGKIGRAGNFNTSTGWVNLPNTGNIFNLSGLTISAWINPASGCSTTTCAIFSALAQGWKGYGFRLDNGYLKLRIQDDKEIVTDTNPLSLGGYSFVTATIDGCTTNPGCYVKIYVNGSLRTVNVTGGQSPAGGPYTGAPEYWTANTLTADKSVHIGSNDNDLVGGYFQGQIDEVGVWKRALTAEEVSILYNSGNGFTYP